MRAMSDYCNNPGHPPAWPDIRSLVPHAGPMVLLDRVLAVDAETLCAEVTITADSLFFDGQGVGAWVGLEYMAQAIAAHAGYAARLRGDAVKIGFLLGARRYECSQPCFALGSVLQVHVQRALQGDNGLGAFECRIDAAPEVATATTTATAIAAVSVPLAHATITVYQPPNAREFLQEILE
jgi:predicted hotdog family 3-hydroxylacyl-ACP dehydratase